jgi:HAD superfamily hydrolase (TIGR01484 family)
MLEVQHFAHGREELIPAHAAAGGSFRPVAEFPREARARVRVVLTDIDDTLTENGRLPAIAYAALEKLHEAGILVVPVTGRPAGWCDLIARQWPVDGVVGENGAFYFRYDDGTRKMTRRYATPAAARAGDRARLDAIRDEVLTQVPGSAVAGDQAYREADLAIDFSEDVPPLGDAEIDRILAVFHRHGAVAKISSIHVNGWFGGYDKLTTSLGFLSGQFGFDGRSRADQVVFVGDSPNDSPMFAFFPNAVGVGNVRRFADRLAAAPAWITERNGGHGFAELAELIIESRS